MIKDRKLIFDRLREADPRGCSSELLDAAANAGDELLRELGEALAREKNLLSGKTMIVNIIARLRSKSTDCHESEGPLYLEAAEVICRLLNELGEALARENNLIAEVEKMKDEMGGLKF